MNNREVERKLADAIAKTAPNDINGVLSRISDEKGTVLEVMKTKNNTKRYLKGAIAACLALAIMSGGGAYYTRACTVSTVVSLDVNPSIELKINSLEKVISCSALNDEAKDVLAEMDGGKDLKGTDIDVAVNALIGALVRHGYLDSISSAILVSVEDKDSERAAKLRQSVTETVDSVLSANSSSASVLSQTVSKDKKLDELAKKNNISGGKAALVEKVREINPSLEFEALSALSVEELKDLRETGAPALPIGKDKALEIAMAASGFSADEVYTETDSDLDEKTAHYDVEIKHNGTEYEYKIDAYTGEILETKEEADDDYTHRAETKEQNPPIEAKLSTESGSEISLDKAKEVALSYAGVTVEQAVVRKAKLNHDDGRVEYELEFIVGNTEYEYDIDASTGEVISSSVETKNIEASQKSSGGDIGEEKARTIALNHAGVKAADAVFNKAKLDYDDGRAEYDIEFVSGNTEYEYDIDASTGEVISSSVETKNIEASQKSSGGDIGIEKARTIALNHAGVKAADAYELEAELDHDDGVTVYEIEFKSGNMEYEYKVDAYTGAILEHEAEIDD